MAHKLRRKEETLSDRIRHLESLGGANTWDRMRDHITKRKCVNCGEEELDVSLCTNCKRGVCSSCLSMQIEAAALQDNFSDAEATRRIANLSCGFCAGAGSLDRRIVWCLTPFALDQYRSARAETEKASARA